MNFLPHPVLLWTDILVFLLLVTVIAFGVYASKREPLRAPWRMLLRSRMGIGSLVVLLFYILIALIDSVHLRLPLPEAEQRPGATHATEVVSLFDLAVTPLRVNQEKSYSAPLATHLYSKESIELPDGTTAREYPRLSFGGAHLSDPEREWRSDVVRLTIKGSLEGVSIAAVIAMLLIAVLSHRSKTPLFRQLNQVFTGTTPVPWHIGLLILALILTIGGASTELAGKYHLLGTDKVGEDVLYQSLKSVRTGILIGTLTTLVMLPAAILLGIMAGYFRGWVDDLIQYLYTTLNSIPSVLLIAAAILMLQIHMANHEAEYASLVERADLRLLFLCLILGVTSWTGLCRLLRGESIKLREMDYVHAATALGVSHGKIILRHILPNVLHIVLITVVLDFSGLVLAEAALSYVNIGVDPTMNSWGNMINSARLEMAREPIVWWSLCAALLFMFALVLAANLFADVVRDALDPRLRNSR